MGRLMWFSHVTEFINKFNLFMCTDKVNIVDTVKALIFAFTIFWENTVFVLITKIYIPKAFIEM